MVLPYREVRFQLIPDGLYYFDAADRENIILLIKTVSENREGFTLWEYKGPQEARRVMHLLGLLSEQDFDNMVCSNIIVNCPVTFDGVINAKLIFGPDIT